MDSRKFAVARLAPKKYGDQISHDGHGGAALNFQPAILIRVTGAAEADVRSASEEDGGVLRRQRRYCTGALTGEAGRRLLSINMADNSF